MILELYLLIFFCCDQIASPKATYGRKGLFGLWYKKYWVISWQGRHGHKINESEGTKMVENIFLHTQRVEREKAEAGWGYKLSKPNPSGTFHPAKAPPKGFMSF